MTPEEQAAKDIVIKKLVDVGWSLEDATKWFDDRLENTEKSSANIIAEADQEVREEQQESTDQKIATGTANRLAVETELALEEEEALPGPVPDWKPFMERPEFRDLGGFDPKAQVPMREREGAQPLHSDRVAEAESRTEQLTEWMVGVATGLYDQNDIAQIGGEEGFAELFGSETTGGFLTSGWKFQSLGRAVSTGSFGAGATSGVNEFADKTVNEIQSAYHNMTDPQRDRFNASLWQSGYYADGAKPTPGSSTPASAAAFNEFIRDNNANPDMGGLPLLEQRRSERYAALREPGGFNDSISGSSGAPKDRIIQTSDPETIRNAVRRATSEHLGQGIEDSALEAIVSEAVARERASKERYWTAVDASAVSEDTPVEEADIFLDAIERRRGGVGNLISDRNFTQWARLLTGNPALENTPETQRDLGRRFAVYNYDLTGSWGDVAGLFADGPGAGYDPFQSVDEEVRPASNFAEDVLQNMATIEQERFGPDASQSGTNYQFVEDFDVAAFAEREVRARNRAQAQTWQYAQHGAQFYDLLRKGSMI
jgi:hypothetical protein